MADKPITTSVEESQIDAESRRAAGEFVRGVSGFRAWIGDSDFPAEPVRYHLFVASNCPWCHSASPARNVLRLEGSITMDMAFPGRTDDDDPEGPNPRQFALERVATLTGAPLP